MTFIANSKGCKGTVFFEFFRFCIYFEGFLILKVGGTEFLKERLCRLHTASIRQRGSSWKCVVLCPADACSR